MKLIGLNFLYLSKEHAGGKDQVGLNLLRGLHENKQIDNIIVICYDYSKSIILDIAPSVKVVSIKSLKATNEFLRILHLYKCNTINLPKIIKENSLSIIFHLSLFNGMRRLKTITIVNPHDIKQIAYKKEFKIPYWKYLIYKIVYYLDFLHADNIIAISETDKKDIINYFGEFERKVERIYNPIIIPSLKIKDYKDEKYIIAINLQFHHKNIITLIKAYELIENNIEHKLVLVGNIPSRVEYLREYVYEHNLENKIIFTGWIKEEKMYDLLSNASLYINSTLFEGFGMTAIEALLQGVPTLVSNIPTNYEVTKGLCYYYDDLKNYMELANKIIYCLSQPYDQKYYESVRNIMGNEYNYLNISNKYMTLFKKKLDKI